MPHRWQPQYQWDSWPEVTDLFDAAEYTRVLTERFEGVEFFYTASIRQPPSHFRTESLREFKTEITALELERLGDLSVRGRQRYGDGVDVMVLLGRGGTAKFTLVRVEGEDRTTVEGIFAQVREFMDERITRAEASRAAAASASKGRDGEPDVHGRLRRVLGDQWTVVIVGTTIATVVAGLVLALVLSH